MNPFSSFGKRRGTTLAGIFSTALLSVLLFCGAGSVPVENFAPQGAMQSDLNAGGHSITNAAMLSTTNLVVNGTNFTAGGVGPQGPTGPQGAAGVNGTNGVAGAPGSPGPSGTNGLQGPAGSMGSTGATGAQGAMGVAGSTGANGTNGVQGPQGPAGTNGLAGATGPQGSSGTNGLQGPVGPTGSNGATGAQGAMGSTGLTGSPGGAGANGTNGAQGPQGVAGATGPTGATGANGAPGASETNGVTTPFSESSTGSYTFTRTGTVSHATITLNASTSVYAYNLLLPDTGFNAGDELKVKTVYVASATPGSAMFYDGSTGGTLLLASAGTTNGGTITHSFYFDGATWNLMNDGAPHSKDANLANGPMALDANALAPVDARTINSDNQTFVVDGSSIDNGYNLSSFTQAWFYLLSKMPWMLNHSAQFVTAASGSSSSANITVTSASGIRPYMFMTGTNIPAGASVASTYTIGSTTVPLTATPTGTVSSATFYSIYDYGVTTSYIGDAGNDVTNSIYYRYFEPAGVQLHRPQASATSTAGTGTIAINTSGIVTGTGTAFTTQTPAGSTIYAGGVVYTITASPTSATAATVSPAPSVAVAAGTSFTIGGDAIGRAVLFTGMTCAYNELRFALNVIQTGTVGVDTSGNVTGSGTTFTNLIPGVTITVNGTYYTVSSISSATAMVVTPAPGTAIATGTAWFDSRTPASCIADLASYATQARSDGFYDVMMTSIMNGTTSGGSVYGPQLDTVDNAAYKGGPSATTGYIPYDRLIDFAPIAPNFNDTTSYGDGTHPTAQVQQQMAFKANATMIADGSFQNATGPNILRSTTIAGDANPLTIIQGASGGYPLYDIDPYITSNHNLSVEIGEALTAKNYMQWQFLYSSSGSNSNYMDMGLPSSGDLLWEFGSGDWQITSSNADQGYTLYVGGTFDATGAAKFGSSVQMTANLSTAAVTLVTNSRYVANGASSIPFTLPTTAAVGDTEEIDGAHAGAGWTVAQNAGQTIYMNGTTTTTGASHGISSANTDSCVVLVCTVANTTWTVRSNEGALATY